MTGELSDERLRAAYAATRAGTTHPDEVAWERLLSEDANPAEREALVAHALACADCARSYKALLALRRQAAAFDPAVPSPRAATAGRAAAPWLPLAAGLGIGLLGGALWSARPASPTPPAAPVMRSNGAVEALAVEALVDLEPESRRTLRRAVSLLTCPAPSLRGADRLDAALVAPTGGVLWSERDVAQQQGRVRAVADLRAAAAGLWALEVRRSDLADRVLEASRCEFEIR